MYIVFDHEKRKQIFTTLIKDWIVGSKKVIDIGCGGGEFSEWFKTQGYETTSIDVKDKTRVKGITPILYDGKTIPFKDKEFDLALLFTVLHHTPDPKLIIKEAARASKRIIIIEDIYANSAEKFICMANCSIANREIINHPHSNKDDKGWKKTFNELGLKLLGAKYFRQLFYGVPLYHGVYLLESQLA